MKAFFFVCLLVATGSHAATYDDVEEARDHTSKIMKMVASGQLEEGLRLMKPYLIVPEAEFESMVGQAKLQLPAITQRFGKSLGMEFIKQTEVGESFIQLVYVSKYEKHAMRWLFYLYKSKDGWVINTFNFDDQIQALFLH